MWIALSVILIIMSILLAACYVRLVDLTGQLGSLREDIRKRDESLVNIVSMIQARVEVLEAKSDGAGND